MESTPVNALTLDLDGVLWNVWPVIARAETKLHQWLAEHYPRVAEAHTPESLRAVNRRVEADNPAIAHDVSALRKCGLRLAAEELGYEAFDEEAAYRAFMKERNKVSLFSNSIALLDALNRRFPVVSVTNGNADVHAIGIGAHFHDTMNPAKAGAKKPDTAIFEAAASLHDQPLETLIHIGDEWETDIQGALNAGMRAIWYNPDKLTPPIESDRVRIVHRQLDIPKAVDQFSGS